MRLSPKEASVPVSLGKVQSFSRFQREGVVRHALLVSTTDVTYSIFWPS